MSLGENAVRSGVHHGLVYVLLWIGLFVAGLSVAHAHVSAATLVETYVQRAKQQALDQKEPWRRLLYVAPGQDFSQVHSPDFFLARDRWASPSQELRATIDRWFEPAELSDPDQHPRCRFPARYLWLAEQLGVPEEGVPPAFCAKYWRWRAAHDLRSVSLIVVGAYLGNPASSFGHTLLRLNTSSGERAGFLSDTSLNFGALVPPRVGTLEYVLKGLSGGFEAGFSDAVYYTQDLVYTRTEFRDAWDYEIALDAASTQRLLAHVWEMVGKKFDYYFLTHNCALRILELLQVALEDDLTQRPGWWFLPAEAVLRLQAADQRRQRSGRPPLIRTVRFVPSAERALDWELQNLDARQRRAWRHVVGLDEAALEPALPALGPASEAPVLDAALAYYQYRMTAQPYDAAEDSPTHRARARVLRARFRLPEQASQPRDAAPYPATPDWRAMRLTAGAGYRGGLGFATVGGVAYERPLVMPGRDDPAELVLGRWALRVDQGASAGPRLDQFEFLQVTKLKLRHVESDSVYGGSWRLAFGVESLLGRAPPSWGTGYRVRGQVAYGWARFLAEPGLVGFAMLDVSVRSSIDRYAVMPHIGLLARTPDWAGLAKVGPQYEFWNDRWAPRAQFELHRKIGADWSAALIATRHQTTQVGLSLSAHW